MFKGALVLMVVAGFLMGAISIGIVNSGKYDGDKGKGALGPFSDLDCTFTKGFWKNHVSAWPVTELRIGSVVYDSDSLLDILKAPGSDQHAMVSQLVTVLFNKLSGVDTSSIDVVISDAHSHIGGTLVNTTYVSGPMTTLGDFNDVFSDFNEGSTGPGECDDEECPPCPSTSTAAPCPTTSTVAPCPSSTTQSCPECPEICPTNVTCTPTPIGACCVSPGPLAFACTITTELECFKTAHNAIWNEGKFCNSPNLPEECGACKQSLSSKPACSGACWNAFGFPRDEFGNDLACDDIGDNGPTPETPDCDCFVDSGACCGGSENEGACFTTTKFTCTAQQGTWIGGKDCSHPTLPLICNACPNAPTPQCLCFGPSACCFENTCSIRTEPECSALGKAAVWNPGKDCLSSDLDAECNECSQFASKCETRSCFDATGFDTNKTCALDPDSPTTPQCLCFGPSACCFDGGCSLLPEKDCSALNETAVWSPGLNCADTGLHPSCGACLGSEGTKPPCAGTCYAPSGAKTGQTCANISPTTDPICICTDV
jgi:hypothetical protein